ncbi:MAG: RNA-binding protein [Candidatus Shapirobacteria bacterium]
MAPIKLYVGNLPWSATSDELGQKFSEAGQVVSAQVITDRYSGRSRGFGFVEMESQEAADKAIEMFNGKDFNGREITVNIAKPREDSDRGGNDRGGRDERMASEPEPAQAEPASEEIEIQPEE